MSLRSNPRTAPVARVLCLVLLSLVAAAPDPASASDRPDGHAPIGVMGDHTHEAGEFMLSYRYMRMNMNGLRDDDERISTSKVLQSYPVAPQSMDMEMHMFGAMWAPIDRLTLMLMVPYVRKEMDHRTGTGLTFTTRTDGVGDIKLSGLVKLWENESHELHLNLGISFPTGSISEQDDTPPIDGTTQRLPYPMQLGTGTYDFLPGITYNGHLDAWSWGGQARGEVRMNENHAGYRVGNEYALTAWGARELARWVSASLRVEWSQSVNYRGRDESSALNPAIVATADPGKRAAMRLDALAGLNFIVPATPLEGIRFAVEAGLPVYQRLDGPGLETDWILTVGTQYAF